MSHDPGAFSAHRNIGVRAYKITAATGWAGKRPRDILPGLRVFVGRVHRGDQIIEADADTELNEGDVVAISGPRNVLVERVESMTPEVDDLQLLDTPVTAVAGEL